MRKNLKNFSLSYGQSILFVVKYNKVVKNITNTINSGYVGCIYYIYGILSFEFFEKNRLCV